MNSPQESHVSVTQRKSSPVEEKKLFKMNILLAKDLLFIRAILAGITSEVVHEAKTSGFRFVEFNP